MTQALSTIPSISSISSLITRSSSSSTSSFKFSRTPSPCLNIQMSMSQNDLVNSPTNATISVVSRRNIIALGIASAVFGLENVENNALAAARRPPPPPQEEKKDPNISGVQAKVLASRKRKEAMKQAMAQQREKGKKIDETSNKKVEETSKNKSIEETSNKVEETSEKKIEESSDVVSTPSP